MLGAIIGDIVGSRFERHNHKSKDFDLFTDRCRFTDDTAMTVAVAKALLECKGDYTELSDHTVRCMQEIGRKYPNAGYGQIFYLWLHHKNPGPYRSYGNVGSLLLYLKGVDRMEKILRLNEQDIIQALADHFNVDRAKVNLTVKIRTEGYGPTEHQFPEVSAVIKEG